MKKQLLPILILSTIIIALIVIIFFNLYFSENGSTAVIYLDNEIIHKIDLSTVAEPYEFDITTEYGHNRIRVEQNRIAIISADCPDNVCVDMGYINSGEIPVICLPHHLCIEIDGHTNQHDAAVGGVLK